MIRNARLTDATRIAEIWNEVIRCSTATFESVEKSPDEVAELIAAKDRVNHPFLVSVGQGVDGFATYGQFRPGSGYTGTMEHTIHLVPKVRRQGRGTILIRELERYARDNGVHPMIAAISGENVDAARFHTAMGYQTIASLPKVGRKFGRWFDLLLMQQMLQAEESA